MYPYAGNYTRRAISQQSPNEVCIGVAVSVKKYLCRFYYSISQKVITLSGRRFITVSGVLLHYRAVITLSGVFYYIIGQLLQYRAFITLSVGTPSLNEVLKVYVLVVCGI